MTSPYLTVKEIIELEFKKTHGVALRKALSFNDVPGSFPHRTPQLKALLAQFHGLLQQKQAFVSKFSQILVLQGPAGTGKTALAQRFGQDLETLANKQLKFQTVFRLVNCRRHHTVFALLTHLLQSLIPFFPSRGFGPAELIRQLVNHLYATNTYLLLVLDEIDVQVENQDFHSLLYNLTRLQEDMTSQDTSTQKFLSLILLTRQENFFEHVDASTRSSIGTSCIVFPAYTAEELEEIVRSRLQAQGYSKQISDETITQIAEYASHTGDARYALQLCLKSHQLAVKAPQPMSVEHVHKAQSSGYNLNKELLEDLILGHKVFLLSIARTLLASPQKDYTNMAEIKVAFKKECALWKLKLGQGNTNRWLYMRALASYGLIQTQLRSKGLRGRITIISVLVHPQVFIDELERQVALVTQIRVPR